MELGQDVPMDHGGGVLGIASLARALQGNFAVANAVTIAILLLIDLFANLYEFLYDEYQSGDERIKMALWVRSLDWATAATTTIALMNYLSVVATFSDLIQAAFSVQLGFTSGKTAIALYFLVAAATILSALIKTFTSPVEIRAFQARKTSSGAENGMGEGAFELGVRSRRRPAPYESNINRSKVPNVQTPVETAAGSARRKRPEVTFGRPAYEKAAYEPDQFKSNNMGGRAF
jgi:hypothetical protein